MNLWWNDYVGLPYQEKGRTREGLDCWGLARIVYKEQFDIDLPSFSEAYEFDDDDGIQEAINARREGWISTDSPRPGDIVTFRILGRLCHIGICAAPGTFLHISAEKTSSIEKLNSGTWKNRIEGFYRYEEKKLDLVTLAAIPHPLKSERIDGFMPYGMTLSQIISEVEKTSQIRLPHDIVLLVNGYVIPKEDWDHYMPAVGSRIEYRAVAGKDVLRTIATIAVIIAAYYYAPYIAGSLGFTSEAAILATRVALTVAGQLLVNSVFPVRLPEPNANPGFANAQLFLQGGQNQVNAYGGIPIVLGRFRYTPPFGAIPYTEATATDSYLRALLVWGYGPVQVSDIRVGENDIETLEDVLQETIVGYQDSSATTSRFNSIYGKDVSQNAIGIELENTDGSPPWTESTISDVCDQVQVTLHFPEGLRTIAIDGSNAGKIYGAPFTGQIQIRQLDSDTLEPITDWVDIEKPIKAQTISLQPAWYNIDNDQELEKVYRWIRLSIDEQSKIIVRYGAFTTSSSADPTGDLLTRLQNDNFGVNATFSRLPTIPSNEEPLYDILTYGNTISSVTDNRDLGIITGCALTQSGLTVSIASGTIDRVNFTTVKLGDQYYGVAQPYYKRKDAFSYNVTFDVPNGAHQIRAKRTNTSVAEYTSSGVKYQRFHKCYLQFVTGYQNLRPVSPPKPLCMTALRIKATNQLSGSLPGVTGTVQSICLDWDYVTETWINRPTRNPASLLRYVLQHPANAQKVSDSQINLTELITWHTYCRTNSFMYDAVITQQRSLYEVMRDIGAAGRASPTLRDGKWTVIIDKEQSTIAQHFTPHNSWGFESTKAIPVLPHAFRVSFNNAEKGYEADEMIVYNDGYSSSNATLFESLTLPGVTLKNAIYKHTRFHFAQLKLRPETYTLNADIEHIICTRGDLVRVTHDVPLWGLGSGRIKNRVSSTVLDLDEPVYMAAGTQYTIRIRLEDGSSITRTVDSKVSAGYYTQITLTSSVTETEGKPLNLFMFGALSSESVELIVQAIEPLENLTARITLVDYSPAVYDSDDEVIPAFDSQITLPSLPMQNVIRTSPTITQMQSDDAVVIYLTSGSYQYNLKVSFSNPQTVPIAAYFVEGQIDFDNDGVESWQNATSIEAKVGALTFNDVEQGADYKVRLRYVDAVGRAGPWIVSSTHTIVGKTQGPSTPTGLVTSVVNQQVEIDWENNPEPDVTAYEVRSADSGWGTAGFIFRGDVSAARADAPAVGSSQTYYVKAINAAGIYSTTAASITFTPTAVPIPTGLTYSFFDTSKTSATLTLDWSDVSPQFGLKHYKVTYSTVTKYVNASTITVPADWIGSRTFNIQAIDLNGNVGTALSESISKLVPSSPTGFRASVIDNNVMLYWNEPAVTTLPISHYIIKKGDTYSTATNLGRKDGLFTTINENAGGLFKYWVETVDTDGYSSTPISITARVAEPPDFVFFQEFNSTFDETLSSAILENGAVVLPVNTTETWADHFTNNSWTDIQDQIDAGFPYYIQPTNGTGYYEEVFDYGTILSSSSITVQYGGTVIDGSPDISVRISTSDDNVTYSDNDDTTQIYATNFRYVKIRISVTETDGTDLYVLQSLSVRLDAKLINDAGSVSALSTDTSGTIANFNKQFVDVQSITASAAGTAVRTVVYDFQDTVLTGTYSVTSNVATISVTGHGLIANQNVRLSFTSGTAPNGVYSVASVTNANEYTVNITTANTSGNVSTYPEGFRVYVFDGSGTRVSATVSWAVKGY